MTQHGLAGLNNTQNAQVGRAVQDKTFYISDIRQRLNLISEEMDRLQVEIVNANKEASNLPGLEKK